MYKYIYIYICVHDRARKQILEASTLQQEEERVPNPDGSFDSPPVTAPLSVAHEGFGTPNQGSAYCLVGGGAALC